VRAVVHKRKRSYAHARAVEVLEPSPERLAPVAAHPGVPWQVIPYERQLEIKRAQVDEALTRIGRLDGYEMEEIVPALQRWRYRNKLEYSFGGGADGDPTRSARSVDPGELVCGFHASAGAGRVEPMDDCLLASERGNRARELVLAWCREQGLAAWERGRRDERDGDHTGRGGRRTNAIGPAPDGRPQLRNVVVREGRRSATLQVRLVTSDGELDVFPLAQVLRQPLDDEGGEAACWAHLVCPECGAIEAEGHRAGCALA